MVDTEEPKQSEPASQQAHSSQHVEKKEAKPTVFMAKGRPQHHPAHRASAVHHESSPEKHGKIYTKFAHWYDKKYKELLVASMAILVISILIIIGHFALTGKVANLGIDLQGGVSVTINKPVDVPALKAALAKELPNSDLKTQTLSSAGRVIGVSVEASEVSEQQLLDAIRKQVPLSQNDYVTETVGASLGKSFFQQAMWALLITFILMAAVVLIYFRDIVPSMFVILCAVSDMLATFAVLLVLNVKITSAGVAAFIMLIGYSIDTDILLTTRVLKHNEGTIVDRTLGAMTTGMTMSYASAAATLIAYFIIPSQTLREIMLILAVGLFFDVVFTWMQNATILRWHLENKDKKADKKGASA